MTMSSSTPSSSSKSLLETLAARIAANAEAISAFNAQHRHPNRSFDRDAPTTLLPPGAPQDLRVKQQELIDAASELQLLATDVNEYLVRQAVNNNQFYCLRWLFHFRIPTLVPLDRPIAYSELAAAAKVPDYQLKSIARMAILIDFFTEPEPGLLAHSSTSAAFATTPSLLEWGYFLTSISAPMTTRMVEATERWGATDAKNHTAYNIAHDTDLPIFQHVASSPELSKQYASYMKNQTMSEGNSMQHVVNGFDWASLGEATVVDVGGSMGHASAALASAFPHLNLIVQDLPDTIRSARAAAASASSNWSESVAKRITFQEHDFFTPQPVANVDAFFLRMILHDWRSAECVTILRHLISALKKPNGRIIVMDIVLPRAGAGFSSSSNGSASTNNTDNTNGSSSSPALTPSKTQEAALRVRDLTMLQAHNSHERDLDDWMRLFAEADPALKLRNVVQPFKSVMAVMELSYGDK
ncbi:hypothetical protein VTN96DRAFT_6326 [Rasamsonia emersonii]